MTSYTPRPHQTECADAIDDAFRSGVTRPMVNMCVGSGKSIAMATTALRNWQRGERTIILSHRQELVTQDKRACDIVGVQCGINAAKLGERTWRAPVISAMINSVHSSASAFGPVQNILIDECFPAGTSIETPGGPVAIETVCTGDMVHHALGTGCVEAVSKRNVSDLVELEFSDGSFTRCTENHPIFTTEGWTSAKLASGRDVVTFEGMRELRRHVQDTRAHVRRSNSPCISESMEQKAVLFDILLQEAGERYARSWRAGTDDGNHSANRTSAQGARRQRSRDDQSASGIDLRAWAGMGRRIGSAYENGQRERVSDTLQTRHCEPPAPNSDRGRRSVALRKAKGVGCEERRVPALLGVVRVSRIELASPCTVYNLQVSGHPSYFANGSLVHNCHLVPHSEQGMYRAFLRGFPGARVVGYSGTPFRLQGGSLVTGDGALFEKEVYTYDITDGIRDGYLVPGFSAEACDKIDVTKLKKAAGEYTASSQDAQTIALMDSHICQMKLGGADRKSWLIFEASQKAATAMTERLNAWGIPAGMIIDKTKNREEIINAFNAGRLRALVNVESLTTGFDSQRIDLVCFRRRTTSLGLYVQMCGRGLRTIGGNMETSIAAGKSDCLYYDFAGLIGDHGPLDFLRPKEAKVSFTTCESCSARNAGAAMRCWACDEPMTKLCPHCLGTVVKGTLDCPTCGYDMRTGTDGAGREPQKLLETPTGAALISSYSKGKEREGGWLPIRKVHSDDERFIFTLESGALVEVAGALATHAADARWIREDGTALLKPNGSNRNTVLHVTADGVVLPIPMPPYSSAA